MIEKDQIRDLLRVKGWKQRQLAAAVGVEQSTVSRWLAGDQRPSAEQQEKLQELVEQSAGEVPDFTGGPLTTRQNLQTKSNRGKGSALESPAPPLPEGSILREYDLRGGASYGGGYALTHVSEDGEPTANHEAVKAEWVIPPTFLQGELRLSPGSTDIIAIDGPSMVPDLLPGDRVLIDRSHRDPRQGGIFAVREDDGIIIKHVEVIRGSEPLRIVCKSSNATYAPFELILDGENVAIIGRVAGRISRM